MSDTEHLTAQEAIAKLAAIDASDPEEAHAEADMVLLRVVPTEVADAYDAVGDRAGAWWYA